MIELILVLMVLGIAIGIAAPSLKGWGMNGKIRDASQQFISATRYAQSQAAADATTYRLTIDPAQGVYTLSKLDANTWTPAGNEFSQPTALPDGFQIQLVSGGSDANAIDFYPDLRATPAVVRFIAPTGVTGEVRCDYPASSFAIAGAS